MGNVINIKKNNLQADFPSEAKPGRRASSERRRRDILEATLRIVEQHGLRGVRHRAVALEANVPVSATTYYFKDISDLVVAAFELFVEQCQGEAMNPWEQAKLVLGQYTQQDWQDPLVRERILEALTLMGQDFLVRRLQFSRGRLIVEQTLMAEAARNSALGEVMKSYQRWLYQPLLELCQQLGIADVEVNARLLLTTLLSLEYEGMLYPMDEQRQDRMKAVLRQQLSYLLCSTH